MNSKQNEKFISFSFQFIQRYFQTMVKSEHFRGILKSNNLSILRVLLYSAIKDMSKERLVLRGTCFTF